MEMSEKEIKKLFGIKTSPEGFISNFSLKEELNNLLKDSYHLYNEISILVKPSQKLKNYSCPKWTTFQNKNDSVIFNNLIDFICEIKKEFNDKDLLNLYILTDKIEKIDNLEEGNIKEQIEIKCNEKIDSPNIIESIGLLFNYINSENLKKKKNGKFLRIILMIDKNSQPIDIDKLISVMNTFNSSNRNYEKAVLNILTIDECDNINNLKQENLYKKEICDNLNFEGSIQNSENEINNIYSIIIEKEKVIYEKIENFFSEINDLLSKNELKNFIKSFDESYIDIQNLNNAILNNLSLLIESNNDKRKEKIQNEIRDDVFEKNLIDTIINKVKENIGDKKNDYSNWERNLETVINNSKQELENLKSKFNNSYNNYWEKKYDFIQKQIDNVDNFRNKINNIDSYLKYVEKEIEKNANKIIESPQ